MTGALAVVAGVLLLVACAPEAPGPQAETVSPTESTGSTAEPDASGTPAAPTSEPTEGPTSAPELPSSEASLDEDIAFDTGVTVSVTSVTTTTVEAETPGQVAGPAVVVEVVVQNESDEPQNVDSAVVTLETSDGELGIPTIAGGAVPFAGTIEPGQSTEARYLFMLDPAAGRSITVTVNYSAGNPLAIFTGQTT